LPGVTVESPQTNMVFVELARERAQGVVERLRERGVLCTGLYQLRFVTHLDVGADDIERAIKILRDTL
ncbi:MAG TPA: low-specificity L-threonine aldolase, partial [Ideonella sp.]|nr:low-specificity L-threonine aldolase [Ideonella sp.]